MYECLQAYVCVCVVVWKVWILMIMSDCYGKTVMAILSSSFFYHYHYTGQQNLTFFFVPWISIDELSSTFYAEFRYGHRIFLSGRVSKIQRNLNVQKSTSHAQETSRNFPLKCRGVWLSPVCGIWYIHLQCPAIVCQHTWGPLALVPLFHSHDVKSVTMFITDFAEIFWEKIQAWLQKEDFQTHIASHSFVQSQ